MRAAEIVGELRGSGSSWEVELADEATVDVFCARVTPVGGYRTGYGAWVLRPNYQTSGDWNDRSSRCHY